MNTTGISGKLRLSVPVGCWGLVVWLLAAGLALAEAPARAADTNKTVITSTRLSFDQQQRTAIFRDQVVVIDPQVKITADKLTILFSPDNTVTNITARGNVVIQQEDKKAMGEQAQYEVGEGKFVLTGQPVIQSGRDMLSADIITFWRESNRILCEPNARLVIRSEQNVFKGGFMKE